MKINITHLYPNLLNLYGDRGNIQVLLKRCEWRGIDAECTEITGDDTPDFENTDILFLGGGSDKEQMIVLQKLKGYGDKIKEYAENGGVVLAVCGGIQLISNSFAYGKNKCDGLGLINAESRKSEDRLTGNIIIDCEIDGESFSVTGFENHSEKLNVSGEAPLGKVVCGFGNDGKSGFEGVLKNNIFATWLHGPLLPKNPILADIIIKRALIKKYGKEALKDFSPLQDALEKDADRVIRERLIKA